MRQTLAENWERIGRHGSASGWSMHSAEARAQQLAFIEGHSAPNGYPGCCQCFRDYRHRLWCIQLIPQIWTNWRTKKTEGLPGSMMFLWASCGLPFGVYAVAQNFNIPLQVQPQIFMALCLVAWAQILLYHNQWPAWKASLMACVVAAVFAGAEAALVLTLRPLYDRGNGTPVMIVGIIAAVLLATGLLPPYGEIWKRRGRVIGINWVFLGMDCSGAFFSLMAMVAQNSFDILGGVLYIVCCVLEIGIFLSHLVWLAPQHGLIS
ncbi:hypothetical protein VTH06DRAFT_8522 [Thermothelomyces fergusii]